MKTKRNMLWLAVLCLPLAGLAQTGVYANVSGMWLEGRKAEVYAMAQQRLTADTNDVAGLCLKMEYEVAFLDFANVTNTMARFLQQGAAVTSEHFAVQFPFVRDDVTHLMSLLPEYPQERVEGDRLKGAITNKPLLWGVCIEALEADGYFEEEP